MFIFQLQNGNAEIVELLLNKPDTDVNAENLIRNTPLHTASWVKKTHKNE